MTPLRHSSSLFLAALWLASAIALPRSAHANGVPDELIRAYLGEQIQLEQRRAQVEAQRQRLEEQRRAVAAQAQAQAEMERQAQLQAARAEYEQCSTGLQSCKSRCSMQTAMGSLGTMNNSAASFQNGMSGLQCLASCEESYSCREP